MVTRENVHLLDLTSGSLGSVLLWILSKEVAPVEYTLLVSLVQLESFTKDRKSHIH